MVSQMNPIHTLSPYTLKICFNIIFSSMSRSSMCSLPFRFSNLNFVQITHFREACYMPCSSHPPWFLFLANWKCNSGPTYCVLHCDLLPSSLPAATAVAYFRGGFHVKWDTLYVHTYLRISLYMPHSVLTHTQLTCPILHVQTQLRVRSMQIIGLKKWVSVLESLITCSLKLIQL
jgi:hypothetical protein